MMLLTSHGSFCKGAYETLNMMIDVTNIDYLEFDGNNIAEYETKLQNKIAGATSYTNIVICTDIIGGTPYNLTVKNFKNNPNILIVSGFNIPLLIGIGFCNSLQEVKQLVESKSIFLYCEESNKTNDDMVEL